MLKWEFIKTHPAKKKNERQASLNHKSARKTICITNEAVAFRAVWVRLEYRATGKASAGQRRIHSSLQAQKA